MKNKLCGWVGFAVLMAAVPGFAKDPATAAPKTLWVGDFLTAGKQISIRLHAPLKLPQAENAASRKYPLEGPQVIALNGKLISDASAFNTNETEFCSIRLKKGAPARTLSSDSTLKLRAQSVTENGGDRNVLAVFTVENDPTIESMACQFPDSYQEVADFAAASANLKKNGYIDTATPVIPRIERILSASGRKSLQATADDPRASGKTSRATGSEIGTSAADVPVTKAATGH